MDENRIDFDDWTAKVTNTMNALNVIVSDFNKRIEMLEKYVKELQTTSRRFS